MISIAVTLKIAYLAEKKVSVMKVSIVLLMLKNDIPEVYQEDPVNCYNEAEEFEILNRVLNKLKILRNRMKKRLTSIMPLTNKILLLSILVTIPLINRTYIIYITSNIQHLIYCLKLRQQMKYR